MQGRFCSKCGNTIKDGDKFCRRCGSPVKIPSPKPQSGIPSYEEIKKRFESPQSSANKSVFENEESLEGTVLLWGASDANRARKKEIKAKLNLSFDEMLRGCRKVVDFGTGKRYEINIPAGLSPGDTVIVNNTGIIDQNTAEVCTIELILGIG